MPLYRLRHQWYIEQISFFSKSTPRACSIDCATFDFSAGVSKFDRVVSLLFLYESYPQDSPTKVRFACHSSSWKVNSATRLHLCGFSASTTDDAGPRSPTSARVGPGYRFLPFCRAANAHRVAPKNICAGLFKSSTTAVARYFAVRRVPQTKSAP